MNPNNLFSLGSGITRFRKNPFRPAEPGGPSFLVPVQPVRAGPIRPAFATPGPAPGPPRPLTAAERVEEWVLRLIVTLLALACLGCGLGAQHIAYVRQKNELGRQLRQRELELRALTQAYRSLEARAFGKAAEDFRRGKVSPVVACRASQRAATRG